MRWERFVYKKNKFIPYDQNNNAKIEAAYQQFLADPSRRTMETVITIKGKFKCTLNFKHMMAFSHGPNKGRTYITRKGQDAGDADAGDASGSEDDADVPVKWERFRADKNRWVPYEKNNNDQIEAAYQKYLADPSRRNREIEITIKGKYTCTLNFKYMNATSHGRNKGRTEIRCVGHEAGDTDTDQDSGSEGDHVSPVIWEYDMGKRWERYDQYNNDQIEDAYQTLQADNLAPDLIEITVNRRYKYTINLNRMPSTSHGPRKDRTDVRRLVDGVEDMEPADDGTPLEADNSYTDLTS